MNGVEALARWHHPHRGAVLPERFVPRSSESGLMRPSAAGPRDGLPAGRRLGRRGPTVPVSVNVSGHQLDADGFPEQLQAVLDESGLAPELLTLESAETVLMRDREATIVRLRALKDLGVKLAADDFGTGYASLAYLRDLPLDSLKIDRSLTAALAGSAEAQAVLRTLVQVGRRLRLDVLAAGIEEPDQLATVQAARCDSGQGFYYSLPLAAEEVAALFPATVPSGAVPSAAVSQAGVPSAAVPSAGVPSGGAT